MTKQSLLCQAAVFLASSTAVVATQLPYSPNRLFRNDSTVYLFSGTTLSQINVTEGVNTTNNVMTISAPLPFLADSESAYTPVIDSEGITVLVGSCQDDTNEVELWRYTPEGQNGTWKALQTTLSDSSLGSDYLSAGFLFSPTNSVNDTSMYIFGGMCPNADAQALNWTSDATYSNTMLTVSPQDQTDYQVSVTGARAPPIAEAGLTITPLMPTSSNTSANSIQQQQNFVLIGGHTQSAFINMSQVALFSMPEESWAFIGVTQPGQSNSGELMTRDDSTVEPRSGHTAVMTEDGSRIVIYGGWVGDVTNPATPQLAILQVGQGYGGSGSWKWTVPTQTSSPLSYGQGIYGHGAVMLSGDIMMISGGTTITPNSKSKRDTQSFLLYNTTSSAWISSYSSPIDSSIGSTSGLKATQKTGLGLGLGLGLAVAVVIVIIWLLYARRLRQKRAVREKELRELALGAERYHLSPAPERPYSEMRSASWNSRQERRIGNDNGEYAWSADEEEPARYPTCNSMRVADRTGVLIDVPSPTRGLRRSLHSRGPMGYGQPFAAVPGGAPGSVFRIDEEEEERSQRGSIKRKQTPNGPRPLSDPFKDPPEVGNEAAETRRLEVKGWVDDWASAAESMNISRNNSKANSRTYSNLSQHHDSSSNETSGRGSPEKSDRTGSNLSDRSHYTDYSIPRSTTGTISRNLSLRSATAGYALFSGAAAAMGKLPGRKDGLERTTSKRSISTGDLANHSARKRSQSFGRSDPQNLTYGRTSKEDGYWTPPESPIKDYKDHGRSSSLTSQGKRALNMLGSVKRVFTGTHSVDVQERVAGFEGKSGHSSPTKHSGMPEMSETIPRRTASAGATLWRHRQGAKDWDDDTAQHSVPNHRAAAPNHDFMDNEDYEGEDWDVETAIQKRVVQVMFTVPKEKLRVVNADSLSLLSKSDYEGPEKDEPDTDIKRMSSVKEDDDDDGGEYLDVKDKGKAVEKSKSSETIGKAV